MLCTYVQTHCNPHTCISFNITCTAVAGVFETLIKLLLESYGVGVL